MNAAGTENGPSLIGVGAAAVNFQVGTGRMPMQANTAQAPAKPVQFDEQDINDLGEYVASLAPAPQFQTSATSRPTATPPAVQSSSASTAPCATTWLARVAH